MSERVLLTYEEALARLPEGEKIHTIRQASIALVGANWARDEILRALRESPWIEETGPEAQSMGHGLAIWEGPSVLFIETREEKKS